MANPMSTSNPRMGVPMATGQQPPPPQQFAAGGAQHQASPAKEVNIAYLCRVGQELVHDVVSKAYDAFTVLKSTQLPNGISSTPNYQDFKAKLDETIKQITVTFRHLHIIHQKVIEHTAAFDDRPIEELLPIEINGELLGESPKNTDAVRFASDDHKEVVAQLRAKNKDLKDIIDKLRLTVWEINTMISTRKILPSNSS